MSPPPVTRWACRHRPAATHRSRASRAGTTTPSLGLKTGSYMRLVKNPTTGRATTPPPLLRWQACPMWCRALRDDSTKSSYTPRPAVNLNGVAQISAGGSTSCALTTTGDVRCWGRNNYGQVGATGCFSCTTPQATVPGVSGVASVTVGSYHACVVLQNKTASCWGLGTHGELSGDATSAAAPGRVVMCEVPDPDACTISPCNNATGGAVTCADKAGNDTSANGRTCTCNSTNFIYSDARGCHGCPVPPPSGGISYISSYPTCSTSPSPGGYALGTACTATCEAGRSGGWARCGLSASGAPEWQVEPCRADCILMTGLPAVPNVVWNCDARVTIGRSCSGSCVAGFEGKLTALCVGPSWSTTGSCTRVACNGPPPSGAPNATFKCASTPVGQTCVGVCATGLSGSPRRVCLADGTWGAVEGDACVDCAANQPKLTAAQPSTSVAAGSTAVSTEFNFTAPFIQGTTGLVATLDGLTACTTQPVELTGAAPTPTAITVSCQVTGGISAGPHKIALTATTTGSNGCSSGSTTSLADILATSAPTPAPSEQLAAAGATAPACKAAAGQPSTASVTFAYVVAPAASESARNLALEADMAASAAGAVCTATFSGGLERGSLEVTCRGIFDSLTSLDIAVTFRASTPGSLEGIATSRQTVAFICCTPASTLAHAVNAGAGSDCQTCGGSASAVDAVWLRGGVQAGVMRAGAISASTCSSATSVDVGSITAVCDEQNSKLLQVTITNPAGSAATKVEFLARCNIDTVTPYMPSCIAQGHYRWRTVTPTLNSLIVTTGPSGEQILTFGVLQATCDCNASFYAFKQTGAFSTGSPVSSSCTAAAAGAGVKAKTAKGKGKAKRAKVIKTLARSPGRRRF